MPTPAGWSTTSAVPLSGNSLTDSLLEGSKWGGALGAGATVSYSFPSWGSSWSTSPVTGYGPSSNTDREPWSPSFSPFSAAQISAAGSALQAWSNVANITFISSVDTSSEVGDIRFAGTSTTELSGFAAFAYNPAPTARAGDIWWNVSDNSWGNFEKGSWGYYTLLHEIGHAIGFKHPFEATPSNSNTLPDELDRWHFTLMSYEGVPGAPGVSWSFQPTTPMLLDIKAAQYLYGPNSQFHAGDDVYTYHAGEDYFETIWDAGGNDTIQYVADSDESEIDLRPGALSNLGNTLFTVDFEYSSAYTVVIYETVTIENAIGGDGKDLIYGNDVANSLQGRGNDDTVFAGPGSDSVEGGGGNDSLDGGDGNDRFDWDAASRAGNDTFLGGRGDDTFVVSGNDLILEDPSEGLDIIWASANYSLDSISNVENLFLFGGDAISATGNALSNDIRGNALSNLLTGQEGNDTLWGSGGNDTMNGGSGQDSANYAGAVNAVTVDLAAGTASGADTGSDTLNDIEGAIGGAAGDVLMGNGTANIIEGDGGNDTIDGRDGPDTLYGKDGRDTIEGRLGRDTVFGGAGDDTVGGGADEDVVWGEGGDDVVYGDSGDDTIDGQDGMDALYGGEGNDNIEGRVGRDTVFGGLGNDTVGGGSDEDVVWGENGNDVVHGDPGNDTIDGQDGFDTLYGGEGNDNIEGRLGRDTVFGGVGDDIVGGGAEDDAVWGEGGNDVVYGDLGNDAIDGQDGLDTLHGGEGDDSIEGRQGNDLVYGGSGNDTVGGGAGNDVIWGDGGNDLIYGDDGTDLLGGGAGSDVLVGGQGADRFYFDSTNSGLDTIVGFVRGVGNDKIDIHDVLVGYNAGTSDIANFVQLQDSVQGAVVAVNADGVGNDFVPIATLQGIPSTSGLLSEMLSQGNIIA